MSGRRAATNRRVVAGAVVLLAVVLGIGLWALLSLGFSGKQPGSTPAASDNGAYYTQDVQGGNVIITRHPIDEGGRFGAATEVYRGPGDLAGGPGVVDGRSPWALLGWFADGVSQSLTLVGPDGASDPIAAASWCGGEGPDGFVCAMLDDTSLARTTVIAFGLSGEASVIVSSLGDGSTLAEHDPFAGLQLLLGTISPDHVLLQLADESRSADGAQELVTGQMVTLDLATGRTTPIGTYQSGWLPLCAVGTDAVIGVARTGEGPEQRLSLVGIGPVDVAALSWPAEGAFETVGCSADARFVFLEAIEPGPDGALRAVVDRIEVATGNRRQVLDASPPVPGAWTR